MGNMGCVIFSKKEDLEDRIIELALPARTSVKTLHAALSLEGKVSLRGVYKAVDKLLDAGVLIKAGKRVMVDEEWVRRVGERLRNNPVPAPAAGERAVYTFTSIGHLDAFWKTIVFQLEGYEHDGQVFFYNPHNFWAYLPERQESETAYYEHFSREKLHAFFTVGGGTEADMEFKRTYQNEYLQIDARTMPGLRRAEHITVLGDFVITVRLSKGLAAKIDDIYASGKPMADLAPEIVRICKASSNIRFTLENNPAKAKKLKQALSLNFYFWRGN